MMILIIFISVGLRDVIKQINKKVKEKKIE